MQHKRRIIYTLGWLLLLILLPWVKPVSAQDCGTQVYVYLDRSGSMFGRPEQEDTMYKQTVDALDRLFGESRSSDIGEDTTVEVWLFGDRVNPAPAFSEQNKKAISEKLKAMRESRSAAEKTDLTEVMKHILRKAEEKKKGYRQLFVVASDFVNDPSDRRKRWEDYFHSDKERLAEDFGNPRERSLFLLKAQARTGDEYLQEQALKDLLQIVEKVSDVHEVLYDGVEGFEHGLEKNLGSIDLRVKWDASSENFKVQLGNLSCGQIVGALTFTCLLEEKDHSVVPNGEIEEGVRNGVIDVLKEPITLSAIGDPKSEAEVEVKRNLLTCPKVTKFEVNAYQKSTGRRLSFRPANAYVGNFLAFEPEIAQGEWGLLYPNRLKLYLNLRGQIVERQHPYSLLVMRDRDSSEVIQEQTFYPPADLDPDVFRPFYVPLDINSHFYGELLPRKKLYVRVMSGSSLDAVATKSGSPREITIKDPDEPADIRKFALEEGIGLVVFVLLSLIFLLTRVSANIISVLVTMLASPLFYGVILGLYDQGVGQGLMATMYAHQQWISLLVLALFGLSLLWISVRANLYGSKKDLLNDLEEIAGSKDFPLNLRKSERWAWLGSLVFHGSLLIVGALVILFALHPAKPSVKDPRVTSSQSTAYPLKIKPAGNVR